MKPALVLVLPLASNTVNESVFDSRRLNVVSSNKSVTRCSNLPMSFIVNRLFGINVLIRSEVLNVYGFRRNLYSANDPVGISGSRGTTLDSP